MGEAFHSMAMSGPLLLALGFAAVAGLVSFLSPCVLPLVPGYLSYMTGLAGADLSDALQRPDGRARGRIIAGSFGFIAGFTLVFALLNLAAVTVRRSLLENRRVVEVIGGVIIVVLGAAFAGLIPGLQREVRLHRLPVAGLASAPVLGVVFAISWIPCIGPTYTAILTLGALGDSTGRAVALGVAYCLGLGLPFLAFGLGYRKLLGVFQAVRRHNLWVTRAGGALLVAVGVALITGAWDHFLIWLKVIAPPGEVGV
jgi:cytochrome c-type biogenesis protein